MMTNTEIIAVGNELLIGDVLDTNTHWLCRRVAALGGRVSRATLVGDNRKTLAEVVQEALTREASVIFTTGGLGPTADDLTLSAIAEALGLPLVEFSEAREMVQAAYTRFATAGLVADDSMTEERRKMASLPDGSVPLYNPVGAAPGVLLSCGRSAIICLPGVPEELKGIFEGSLPPILEKFYGEAYYTERSVQVDCGDESTLAPIVNRLAKAYADIYVKSRAKAYGPGVQLKITLSASGADQSQVDGRLQDAVSSLREGLSAIGVSITRVT